MRGPLIKNIKFGTDGWRAVIAEDYTFENVRIVAHAVGRTFAEAKRKHNVVYIGYDHRFLANEFAREAGRVLSQYRFEPRLLPNPVTSPWLSFVTWKEKALFGVMITASHNPAEYCGFKVKGGFGGSIPQETAAQIEKNLAEVLANPELMSQQRWPQDLHKVKSLTDFKDTSLPAYIDYLKSHIDLRALRKSKATVIFDALYGPGRRIVEEFFDSAKSTLKVQILHEKRDPLFGGLHPEPIEEYLGDLKKAVAQTKCLGGFALDGDADRLGLVDEAGNYLTPQQAFALLLYYLATVKKLKGKVVQAVSLGYLSERIARDLGLPFEETPVGFKYVAERMLAEDVLIGGEESGGYAFSRTSPKARRGQIIPERDGLLCALLLIEMSVVTGKKISAMLAEIQKKYGASAYLRKDLHLARPVESKEQFVAQMQKQFPSDWLGLKVKEMRTLDGLKIFFEDGSWLLMRPSGTEPLLRTYAEFPKREQSQQSLDKLAKIVQQVLAGESQKGKSASSKKGALA